MLSSWQSQIARVRSGHLNECQSVLGDHQLVGQAANLTFKLLVGYCRPVIYPLQFVLLLSYKADTHFTVSQG